MFCALDIGNSIHVLGRDIAIKSCDSFTRCYLQDELGLDVPNDLATTGVPSACRNIEHVVEMAFVLLQIHRHLHHQNRRYPLEVPG